MLELDNGEIQGVRLEKYCLENISDDENRAFGRLVS